MSDAVARNSLLVLLAEDPVPGRVLARLATVLGEARAAALYDAFAADAIRAALDAGCCDTLVALAPGSSGAWLDRIAPEVPRWNRRVAATRTPCEPPGAGVPPSHDSVVASSRAMPCVFLIHNPRVLWCTGRGKGEPRWGAPTSSSTTT